MRSGPLHLMCLVMGLLALAPFAQGFPELTRYGYNTCAACHVSHSGGGLLTPYGRSLSSELLSHWGDEEDAGLFWRAGDREKIEKYLLIGGDVRAVQMQRENASVKEGRFIKMQAELELGLIRDAWGAALTVGEFKNDQWRADSRQFYAFYRPVDEFTVRAGRFVPAYGLRLADHIVFTRSFLGLGLEGQRDSVEAQWTGETWTHNLTVSKRPLATDPESSVSVQTQYSLAEGSKAAVNVWEGRTDAYTRQIFGAWAVIGFRKDLYLMSEFDVANRESLGLHQRSLVSFNRLGWTATQGFDLVVQHEILRPDVEKSNQVTRFGAGALTFPWPHLEFSGFWLHQKLSNTTVTEEDDAWILAHYYF